MIIGAITEAIDIMAEVIQYVICTSVLFGIPICISEVFERERKRKRASQNRELERRHELARHEDEFQRKMACEIWRLEKAKANQQIIIKGCFATAEAAEILK